MKDRTLKQYNPEDIEKIYTKNNKNKLPSQFNEDDFYAKWDRMIQMKDGRWIYQCDELQEQNIADPNNGMDQLFFKDGMLFCRSDHRIYNESPTISFTNRRSYKKYLCYWSRNNNGYKSWREC